MDRRGAALDVAVDLRAFASVPGRLHEFGVWMLLALIGLHAAAALFHGLILRDGVLQRMLPRGGR
jgi:cytochrome b561